MTSGRAMILTAVAGAVGLLALWLLANTLLAAGALVYAARHAGLAPSNLAWLAIDLAAATSSVTFAVLGVSRVRAGDFDAAGRLSGFGIGVLAATYLLRATAVVLAP